MTDTAGDEAGDEAGDTAGDEAGEDAVNGVADPPLGRIGMADRYTIAAQRASRRAMSKASTR
jgi:hypothetical protein